MPRRPKNQFDAAEAAQTLSEWHRRVKDLIRSLFEGEEWAPIRQRIAAHEKTLRELGGRGVTPKTVRRILCPDGLSPLRVLKRAVEQQHELDALDALRSSLQETLRSAEEYRAVSARGDGIVRQLGAMATTLARRHEALRRQLAKVKLDLDRKWKIPSGFWDLTPAAAAEAGIKVERWEYVGDRAMALYDVLERRIRPQRRQALGMRRPAFNQAALTFTARCVNGAYWPYLSRALTSADVKSRLQQRGRHAQR